MRPYLHKVCYYETDQMGFVHHANHIHWFEEARLDYLEQVEMPYSRLEAEGLFIPVLSLECQYRQPVHFGDTVEVHVNMEEFGLVRFHLNYRVLDHATGELRAQGASTHCFIDGQGRPISLKKQDPARFQFFQSLVLNEG